MLKSYKELIVWQEAVNLVEQIYIHTKSFPKEEQYGLTSQIRRASISIPSNIAEGNARKSTKEYLYFLSIANGSLAELETQFIIAERLGYLSRENSEKINKQLHSVWKQLLAMRNSLISRN